MAAVATHDRINKIVAPFDGRLGCGSKAGAQYRHYGKCNYVATIHCFSLCWPKCLGCYGSTKLPRRTTKPCDELAALHSITTPAVASRAGDRVRPSSFSCTYTITILIPPQVQVRP